MKAMGIHGARYLHIHVPCPLGWGSASQDTIRLARLAVECGLFPVFEAEHGVVTGSRKIRRQVPVDEYLKPQRRFAHLFATRTGEEAHRPGAGNGRPQHRRISFARRGGRRLMDHPFAISLDVGSSLANQTGSWRTSRPLYVDRLPPCNNACPAGENIQSWLYHAESGDYEAAWRTLTADNPLPAVMGRVCYHPCESACNRAQIDEAVGINSVERFLGDVAIRKGWRFAPPQADSGKRVLVVGAGPSGLVGRLSPAADGSCRRDP